MQERLERAGMPTKRENGVECCYARQTKFWAHDPDGNLWEVYTLDGDIEHRGAGQSAEVVLGDALKSHQPVVWEHRMTDPVPARIPLADGPATLRVVDSEGGVACLIQVWGAARMMPTAGAERRRRRGGREGGTADIVEVVRAAGKGHGAGTVAKALADLTAAGDLINSRDKRGYRLAGWRKASRPASPPHSFGRVKSAMNSCAGIRPSRLLVHMTLSYFGLNTGSTSWPGAKVSRACLPVSRSIQ